MISLRNGFVVQRPCCVLTGEQPSATPSLAASSCLRLHLRSGGRYREATLTSWRSCSRQAIESSIWPKPPRGLRRQERVDRVSSLRNTHGHGYRHRYGPTHYEAYEAIDDAITDLHRPSLSARTITTTASAIAAIPNATPTISPCPSESLSPHEKNNTDAAASVMLIAL